MARQVIDLRTQEEKQGVTGLTKISQALNDALLTLGKGEKVRRERQQLDRVSTAIAGGASTIEAITAAANEPTQFDTGLRGILQKAGGAFGGSQTGGIKRQLQEAIIGQKINQALNPSLLDPSQQKEAAEVKAGLRPRAPATAGTEPGGQSKNEKNLARDIKILTDKSKDGSFKVNERLRTLAKKRIKANPLKVKIGESDFDDEIKGKPKIKVKGKKFDRAFGKEAYDETLKEAVQEAEDIGISEEAATEGFNQWWDRRAAEKDPKGFGKAFIERSEFETKDGSVRLESAPDVRLDEFWKEWKGIDDG